MIYPDRFYTRKQVAKILGVTPKTIGRWAESGKFAAPKHLNSRDVRWFGSDIIEFQRQAATGKFIKDKPEEPEE